MRRLYIGLLLLAAFVLTTESVHAQGLTTGAVTGTVTDAQGAPLAGAQVQVEALLARIEAED